MSAKWKNELAEIDRLVRAGDGTSGRARLEKLLVVRPPRELLVPCATLAFRLFAPHLGIRLLHPIVRSPGKRILDPTPEERTAYAGCLIRLGAPDEALELLRDIDDKMLPAALFYRAAALVSRWDYAGSIPLWKSYLASNGLSWYERAVARTNLAAALVYERQFLPAHHLLRELLYDASLGRHRLLLGRALELAAEACLLKGEWDRAEAFLDRAGTLLSAAPLPESLFVRKFQSVAILLRSRKPAAGVRAMEQTRAEAVRYGHWETVRDCDYMLATFTADPERLAHVLFGTPYASYRQRLLLHAPPEFRAPSRYVWRLGPPGADPATLDLFSGESSGKASLKVGQMAHRTLSKLASDFYRPCRTATLFAHLCPGEAFHPLHSSQRVHQAVVRLRKWISDAGLPLEITESGGQYSLTASAPFELGIAWAAGATDRGSALFERLRAALHGESFSKSQIAEVLGISPRAALRAVAPAVESGTLLRTGSGNAIYYKFAK